MPVNNIKLFPLGQLLLSPWINQFKDVEPRKFVSFLLRHQTGDFGDIGPEEHLSNRKSLEEGEGSFISLFSSHNTVVTLISVLSPNGRVSTVVSSVQEMSFMAKRLKKLAE